MRKLLMFSLSFAAATACYVWLLPPVPALCAAGLLLAAAIALCFFRGRRTVRVRILAFGAAVGLLWSWGYERLRIEPLRTLCGERTITAEVCEMPQETAYGCRVTARLGGGKILLYLDCAPAALALGDSVTLPAEIVDVSRGSGDEENLYYQSHDISLLGFQRGEAEIERAERLPLSAYPAAAAYALRTRIMEIFPSDTGAFVRALLTGDRSGLTYLQSNAMSIVGISHVVAVSGLHVSLIVAAVMLFCRRRRRLAAGVSIAGMLLFAAMLGFTPSILRATIMNALLLLGPLLGREEDAPTSLGFALLVILLLQPWAIANISLQMSFAAMAGVVLVAPRIYRRLEGMLRYPLLSRPWRSVCALLSTTLGASALTVPLVASTYGTVSLISPLTNLFLLPLISLLFGCGFFTALLGMALPSVGAALAALISPAVRLVLWATERLAAIPYAAIYTNNVYTVAWLVTFYLLLGVFLLLRRGKFRLPTLLASTLLTLVCALVFAAQEQGTVSVTAFDVGQGQCVLLRCGSFTALVDCGGDSGDANGETVARALLMAGHTKLDYLILTHYDSDHVCGTAQLLHRIKVGTLLLPDVADIENRAQILTAAQETGTVCHTVSADTKLTFDGGTLTLFAPPDREAENACVSALLSAAEYDILITGDNSIAQELELLRTHSLPDIEVLLAGHHGSKYSTSAALLDATRPETVLICVGENRYGQPAQETLDRIASVGATVYRTDLDGDITISR